jgi:nucleotide-binding universal stress UspA family protein
MVFSKLAYVYLTNGIIVVYNLVIINHIVQEIFMYQKILVSLALNHGYSMKALELARGLKAEGGEIIAVHAFEPVHTSVSLFVDDELVKKARDSSEDELRKRIGDADDVQIKLLTGTAGSMVTAYAKEVGVDCIILGSHKPGLKDFFLGSTAARIMRYAPCSVHVLRID